uniref:Protein-tyrosine-phosphatase n=1 Tax=Panagrellus redivivus TaxID=6233 RepID=A0A7E4W791_PANRE
MSNRKHGVSHVKDKDGDKTQQNEEGRMAALRRKARSFMRKKNEEEGGNSEDQKSLKRRGKKKADKDPDKEKDTTEEPPPSQRQKTPSKKRRGTVRKKKTGKPDHEGETQSSNTNTDNTPTEEKEKKNKNHNNIFVRRKASSEKKEPTQKASSNSPKPNKMGTAEDANAPAAGGAATPNPTTTTTVAPPTYVYAPTGVPQAVTPQGGTGNTDDNDNDKTQSFSESNKVAKSAKGKKKRDTKEKDAPNTTEEDQIKKFFERAITVGVAGLKAEFAAIPKNTKPDPVEHKAFIANPTRNRYKDVPCVECTRIKLLDHPDGLDYVHANYVATGFGPQRFICAQGPSQSTVYDFWHLAIQESCQSIVMLCNVMENGSPKCLQYWPIAEGDSMTIKDVVIRNVGKTFLEPSKSIAVTTLVIKSSLKSSEQTIRHYQWLTWPDRGVPRRDDLPFLLLQGVRRDTKPILVHCSAGIGRTGSVVIIEIILERIHKMQDVQNMPELIKALRKQRANCVQTDMQYLYTLPWDGVAANLGN